MKQIPVKQVLALFATALGLSACAAADYAYDYDPYYGPRGHYVSHLGRTTPRTACAQTVYLGPYQDEMRGTYYAGPYCVAPDGRVLPGPVAEVATR